MDRMLYLAMSGAKETAYAQTLNNHNLANASTTGFRAALTDAVTAEVRGPVFDSRDYVQTRTPGTDFSAGPLISTGNELDFAIDDRGFFAVLGPDGREAYTRSGQFQLDPFGQLRNERGFPVLGEAGAIALPPFESLLIGRDGTISIVPAGGAPNQLVAVDRLRLVNPEPEQLIRGEDGLIRGVDEDVEFENDALVRVNQGYLEGSNVNTVAALTRMIELSRHFETQVKLMDTADQLERQTTRLLGQS
ncbi:MAG: flagellar basal body rod protein FlgF [Thioalkalivibrionaceae bacterium]